MMRSTMMAALAVLWAPALAVAQEAILIVEKPEDRRQRDALEARLRRIRVDLRLEDEGPKAIAERLNLFAGKTTVFAVKPHDGDSDYASLKLDLKRVSVRNAMSIVQRLSDVRFVFKAGVVMLMHRDDVKETATLRLYDVRVATFRIRNFPGPRLGLEIGEAIDEEIEDDGGENTLSGLTLEKLEEVIRTQVVPDSWDGDAGASITASNGVLIIRQTERGHREIQKLLYQLGVGPCPNATLRRPLRRVRTRPARIRGPAPKKPAGTKPKKTKKA